MIVLKLASCEIVDIISEGIQDEYTRIKSVYFSEDASLMVDIMQITFVGTSYGKFVAHGYNRGKMVFSDDTEYGLGVDLSLAGWQLGEFNSEDTISLTDKGRWLLSSVPYLLRDIDSSMEEE